jgi:hypothetical protein
VVCFCRFSPRVDITWYVAIAAVYTKTYLGSIFINGITRQIPNSRLLRHVIWLSNCAHPFHIYTIVHSCQTLTKTDFPNFTFLSNTTTRTSPLQKFRPVYPTKENFFPNSLHDRQPQRSWLSAPHARGRQKGKTL